MREDQIRLNRLRFYPQIDWNYLEEEEKNIKHDGNITLDQVIEIARTMRPRSMARKLEGTVFEMLGTAFSVGCTVNGEAPMDIMQQIKDGELEVPDE